MYIPAASCYQGLTGARQLPEENAQSPVHCLPSVPSGVPAGTERQCCGQTARPSVQMQRQSQKSEACVVHAVKVVRRVQLAGDEECLHGNDHAETDSDATGDALPPGDRGSAVNQQF